MKIPNDLERCNALHSIVEEFRAEAKRIAQVIVEKWWMSPEKKTIPQMPANLGAGGGLKFFHNSIFFKCSVDSSGIYNGDHNAMKAAGHEMKGFAAYASCSLPNFTSIRTNV